MTVGKAMMLAAVSWLLLLGSAGYFALQGAEADNAIRDGVSEAARVGCQENNERWQLLVDFSNRENPDRRVPQWRRQPGPFTDLERSLVAEYAVIELLTNRPCGQVAERYLERTEP